MMPQTFAHLHRLSFELTNPDKSSRAMHALLCSNMKLERKVLTKNLLRRMMTLRIGTNEVELFVNRISKQNVKKGRKEK